MPNPRPKSDGVALLGKVFAPAGIVCEVTFEGTVLVARGDGRVFRFPLTESAISFAGDADSQVKVVSGDLTFYGERQLFEAPFRELVGGRIIGRERAKAQVRRRWQWAALAAFVFVCLAGVGAVLWISDRAVEGAVAMTPTSFESSISEPLLQTMAAEPVTDPAITEPVEAIVQRLVEAAGPQPYKFRVRVVRNPAVNAFAMPGGGVVVYTGLLEKADSPEEVAGVLAHELQHVLGRHSLRSLYQQLKWQLGLAVLVGNDEGFRQIVLSQAAGLSQLSYGRDMETESDTRGAALMVKAGLSPRGLRDFFVHLAEEEGKSPQPMEFLSTHPATSHRIEALERLAGGPTTRPLDVDWEGLQKALEGDKP